MSIQSIQRSARRYREGARLRRDAMLEPRWERLETPVTEPELFQRLVQPHFNVVCIGGYGDPTRDPSPAFLTKLVKSKRVTLIDVQDESRYYDPTILKRLRQRVSDLESRGRRIPDDVYRKIQVLSSSFPSNFFGRGGLMTYREGVREINSKADSRGTFGVVKLRPAYAWDSHLKPNSVHLVVDRGTWWFIAEKSHFYCSCSPEQPNPELLERTVDHYLSLLKPGGKAVFFSGFKSPVKGDLLNKKLRELQEAGAVHVLETQIKWPKPLANAFSGEDEIYNCVSNRYKSAFVVTKLKPR